MIMLQLHYSLVLLLFVSFPPPYALVSSAALGKSRHENPTQRSVFVRNLSGRRFDIFWINNFSSPVTYVSNSEKEEGYPFGGETAMLSYVGHEFEVREMPRKSTGTCHQEECAKAYFKVNDQENQDIVVDEDFKVIHSDNRQRAEATAKELLDDCRAALLNNKHHTPLDTIDALTECMNQKVSDTLAKQEEERAFQSNLRTDLAEQLVPFACADITFNSTIEVVNKTLHYEEMKGKYVEYTMQLLHERPASQIIRIPKLVTKNECKAAQHFVNEEENNNQVPFSSLSEKKIESKEGLILHALASKLYEVARKVLSWDALDFKEQYALGHPLFQVYTDDQESVPAEARLPICQVVDSDNDEKEGAAVVKKEAEEEEPEPLCRLPGSDPPEATTLPFRIDDDRVATMFLFCGEQPEMLGGIHFPYAGVHQNPEVGMVVIAIHRHVNAKEPDGYVQDYHLCPNYNVFTHTMSRARPQ